ncbi:MAG TPA: double-strand break repair protein AddB [Xanthobacteraceae bacterium]|nr:double-strand break repair protein AddB [Xanthobacteraceae bacterium]
MTARVFTIPASAPFLPTLIDALRSGKLGFSLGDDPLALAGVTLYLPTRRACRLAHDIFLDVLKHDAALLPRIVAIGDIDEDEIAFAEAATGGLAAEALALPEALGSLERRLLLTELIVKWAELHGQDGAPLVAQTPVAACVLADDLARLIDDMTTRGVPWKRLDDLVPEQFDEYWQQTLKFLQIARGAWPEILREGNCIEAAERRDLLIKAEATRLAGKTDGPVIVAGSTGSIPSTAELIATVARLAHGAVVLPGLDTDLDDESWRLISGDPKKKIAAAPGHPQFAMQTLLTRIGISRSAVTALAKAQGRETLASEAMRPAMQTDVWQKHASDLVFAAQADAAVSTITVIEAANAEEEALAIAIALREAVQNGKTAALVTPDRVLGRRVATALMRWNIAVEDTGGDPLTETPAGIFARLAAQAAVGGLEPVTLLALLKHPLLRLGASDQRSATDVLERAVLRGPRPSRGTTGLLHALKALRIVRDRLHSSDPRKDLNDGQIAEAESLVAKLAAALEPLEKFSGGALSLNALAERHRKVLEALSRHGEEQAAFVGPDGIQLANVLDELATSMSAASLEVKVPDYVELFTAALSGRVVRRPLRQGLRVRILGLLEARLTDNDRVVLGGLVEGTWPPESRTDAWLSRPMRLDLGLDLPERRIGLTAHDFVQLLGAPEVIMTLSAKIAGAPTVPSRFIQRLAAVSGDRWQQAIKRGETYLTWARMLDHPEEVKPEPRPEPKPPLAVRPKGLSVTEIEHWLRDPYTIYAKHILRLRPLDPVDAEPGAAERGTFIHAAIAEFAKNFTAKPINQLVDELIAFGRQQFAEIEDYPEARAFWWPRFQRIADWFANWEIERRTDTAKVDAEISGKHEIKLEKGTFRLRGIADRIELGRDGRYTIFDYKTGSARTGPQVRSGLAPQLTLEAAILRQGGFAGIPKDASVADVAYVLVKGGEPPGEEKFIGFKNGDGDSQADHALQRLTELAQKFEDEETPYRSLVHPMWATQYGDYDHLARVLEWTSAGEEDDDGSGE